MLNTKQVLDAGTIIARILKKRFPNLTVEETIDISTQIILELEEILSC